MEWQLGGRERRLGGILLLVVALVGVAGFSALGGRGARGSAVRSPVPVVGDCLVGMTPAPQPRDEFDTNGSETGSGGDTDKHADDDSDDGADSAGAEPEVLLPTGALGDCAADGAGRVVAVSHGESVPSDELTFEEYSAVEARECNPALGKLQQDLAEAGRFEWRAEDVSVGYRRASGSDLEAVLVGPAAGDPGHRWLACYLQVINYRDSVAPIPVAESIGVDRPPDELGSCTTGVPPNATSPDAITIVSCAEPHTIQRLGYRYMYGGRPRPADYQAACLAYAVDQTQMADPTAGGALVVRTEGGGAATGCQIAVADPSRALDGSLVGLGDSPLPWTD